MSGKWYDLDQQRNQSIVKIPLQFNFEPVEIISKELTKLNSPYDYRIHYLGPRWENSGAMHKNYSKKNGYKFDDRQINNNSTFFSDSMCNNQFYRNQIYYRAFEGMNPTIDKEKQLRFDSKFQSGNLDCVVKIAQNQYDLFMRVDSNTRGHLFWFYFEISNPKPNTSIKFNICNMTKSMQLYQKGFKPYTSTKSDNQQYQSWTQSKCTNIQIQKKKLRYQFVYEKIRVRTLYQLSFTYIFESNQNVRFAYCIPYTYTKMIKDINSLQNKAIKIQTMGRSLTGVDIPVVQIGQLQQNAEKTIIFIIGRLHPGQSNGSHVLNGFMNYIAQSSQGQFLRKKLIFMIIPMINPDGVILGNSRTGASGKDLNREFRTKNKYLFPQINKLKNLVNRILQTNQIQMFLDFHGHSRKKNMFLFGPNYNITQPQYYRSRIMPKFLSQLTNIFRYYGCSYNIPPSKLSTARAVMLNQMCIPYVYTIQTSVGLYYDAEHHKDMQITVTKYQQLGESISKAVQQYYESIQQYEQYLAIRKQQSKQTQIPNNKKISPNILIKHQRHISTPQNKNNTGLTNICIDFRKKLPIKDIKLIKIIEQIKLIEQKKNKKKDEIISDASSDSQNQQDVLQKNKLLEFQGMVTQCIHTQKLKKQKNLQLQQKRNLMQQSPKIKRRVNQSNHNSVMKQLLKNCQINTNKFPMSNTIPKHFQHSVSCKNQTKNSVKNKRIFQQERQQTKVSNKYLSPIEDHNKNRQAANLINMKMFNFSQMIQEPLSRNIMTCGRQRKQRYLANMITSQNHGVSRTNNEHQTVEIEQSYEIQSKFCKVSLQPTVFQSDEGNTNKFYRKDNNKTKSTFPASFYRIKYQNYQKKKQKIFQEKQQRQVMHIEVSQQIKGNLKKRNKKNGINFLNINKYSQD